MRLIITLLCALVLLLNPIQAGQRSSETDPFSFSVSVYPNPSSSGNFSIELLGLEHNRQIHLKVYNLIGKEVFRTVINNLNAEYKGSISLGTFPKGIYMLEVSQGEQTHTRRLSFI